MLLGRKTTTNKQTNIQLSHHRTTRVVYLTLSLPSLAMNGIHVLLTMHTHYLTHSLSPSHSLTHTLSYTHSRIRTRSRRSGGHVGLRDLAVLGAEARPQNRRVLQRVQTVCRHTDTHRHTPSHPHTFTYSQTHTHTHSYIFTD